MLLHRARERTNTSRLADSTVASSFRDIARVVRDRWENKTDANVFVTRDATVGLTRHLLPHSGISLGIGYCLLGSHINISRFSVSETQWASPESSPDWPGEKERSSLAISGRASMSQTGAMFSTLPCARLWFRRFRGVGRNNPSTPQRRL